MPRKKPKKTLQRILILGSVLAFLSTFAFAFISMFISSQSQSQQTDTTENNTSSEEERLLKAAEGYQLVLEREPNNAIALQGLIVSQDRLRMFYGRELQQAPSNAENIFKKITARNQEIQNLYQKLETSYRDLLKVDPNNTVALENLAIVRTQLGDPSGAIEPIEKLIELHPERGQYQEFLRVVKQEIERRKAAEENTEPREAEAK